MYSAVSAQEQSAQEQQEVQQPVGSQPSPSSQTQYGYKPVPEHRSFAKIFVVLIVLVLAVAMAIYAIKAVSVHKSTTTVTTTLHENFSNINNCTVISKPGAYYLINSIFTKERNASCISIEANNVTLYGNSNLIKGSGPYAITPPYSYGIEIGHVTGAKVSNVAVEDFSYGIFVNGSSSAVISNVNATNDTMSGMYLYNSYNSLIANSSASRASSNEGGIYLLGGNGNRLLGDASNFNLYSGIVINSTKNIFNKDSFSNNPVDMMCEGTSGFLHENNFSSSTCKTNFYCNFASCTTTNLPTNITTIKLAPGKITTCGTIDTPGNYSLSNSINMAQFLNLSNQLSRFVPCIQIASGYATLNCNNNSIDNSGIAVLINGKLADSVADCNFENDTYAVKATNMFSANISDVSTHNSTYGIYLSNVTGGTLDHITAYNGSFGIYSNSTSGVTLSNLVMQGNKYGIYMNNGASDAFNGGNITKNFKADIYCSKSTYNSTSNLFQGISCGVTDCNWASCKSHVLPQLAVYPLSSCQAITHPGNYSLVQNIVTPSSCFSISASNVVFSCQNTTITGSGSGYAFGIHNATNVSINNCKVFNFDTGIQLGNVSKVSINNASISLVQYGITGSHVASSMLSDVSTASYSSYGFLFNTLRKSSLSYDSATGGSKNSTGFRFVNASQNTLSFNNAGKNPAYGFAFVNFTNNTVYNNTAFSNRILDYYCSPSSSGFYANINGVNSGDTKNACRWLLVLPAISENPPCEAVTSPSEISLQNDMLYTTGTTCYNIYNTNSSAANHTTVNCNGHTVFATSGGTFVNVVNSSNVELENCFIKGFTNAFVSHGPSSEAINNTIADTHSAISLYSANQSIVKNNKISNGTIGISLNHTGFSSVINNTLSNVDYGMILLNSSASKVYGNSAFNGTYGLQLINSTSNLLKNDLLIDMSKEGIACYGISRNTSSVNQDFGNETCSSNLDCSWITSPLCK
ncbi:MAG: NosD domain-containing protein [Candidatus Micrarchaeaceae archaeon]